MMKRFLVCKGILIILVLCGLSHSQQFTTVSGTITDPSSQVWSNAIITANLIPAFQKPGPSLNQGHTITDSLQFIQANGSGTFSLTVDDNTFVTPSGSQWAFTICSNTSAQCNTVTLTISGPSQNISASINAAITNPVVNAQPTILRAYNGVEATGGNGALYWRTFDNTLWGCYALPNQTCSLGGGTWIEIGTGGGSGGTVTSVGLAGPTGIIISNSPVTTTGTLTWSMPTGWSTGSLLIGNGSNSVTNLPIGAANTVLESDGTTAHWQSLMFPAIFYQHVGVNGTTETQRDRLNLIAGTGITITGADSSGTNSTNVTITEYIPCQTGIGDGTNALPAATYHQVFCKNDSGVTITLHGFSCFTDNNGTSTMNAVDQANNALLSNAVTCTNTFAVATQSGTTTIPSGGWINFTFVADGTSTQTTWAVF